MFFENCFSRKPNLIINKVKQTHPEGSKGFTLIEVVVVAGIFALLALVILYIFRSNVSSWKWGQKHMEFNQKVQLAMKQVFTDIKRVNPIVTYDENYNLWFQGEKIGDLFPNLVEIIDTDNNPENGGEEIILVHASYKDPSDRVTVRLFLENGALIRETTDINGTKKKTVISNRVENLRFLKAPGDNFQVRVSMTILDDRNPELKEDLAFAVHLDTHLVCVVLKTI